MSNNQSMVSISSSSDQVYQRPVKYVPDFSVKAMSNVLYLRIRRPHYIAATRATLLERAPKSREVDSMEDPFAKEWKRAISVDPENHLKVAAATEESIKGSRDTLTSPTSDGGVPDGRMRSETQDSLQDGDRAADAGTPLMISSCETMPDTKNEAKS